MNKLITEGKRLAELAKENPHSVGESYTAGGWTNLGKHKEYHSPETMLKIYSLIDEMRVALEFYAVRDSALPIEISPARSVLQKFWGDK